VIDYFKDIIAHSQSLGLMDTVKITGSATETRVDGISDDKNVVLQATFNTPNPDFEGVFGLPNLAKLNTIMNIPEYKENAVIKVTKEIRGGEETPAGLHFENSAGDFLNEYRFMAKAVVDHKIKTQTMRQVTWDVAFEPTQAAIQRFKYQQTANAEENAFTAKNVNGNLEFDFGDHSTHAGNFIFEANVGAKLTKAWSWPVGNFIAILGSTGDKVIQISGTDGVAMITVDSGLVTYNYMLPALVK
jgi:hypothetical protein